VEGGKGEELGEQDTKRKGDGMPATFHSAWHEQVDHGKWRKSLQSRCQLKKDSSLLWSYKDISRRMSVPGGGRGQMVPPEAVRNKCERGGSSCVVSSAATVHLRSSTA